VPTQHVAVHLGLAAHKIKVAHRLILSLGTFTLIVFFFYKVGQISAQCIYIPVTISSIDRFLKFFYHRNQEKMCSNTVTKNSTTPHMCSYTTWWNVRYRTQAGDDTDLLRDQRWSSLTCGPKQPGLKYGRFCCLGCPTKDSLSMSTIHVKQPVEANDPHWMKQSQHLVGRVLSSGVAGLSASSISKTPMRNIWCKNCKMWQLLCTITETINRLFTVVNFLQCVAIDIVLFSIVALRCRYFTR